MLRLSPVVALLSCLAHSLVTSVGAGPTHTLDFRPILQNKDVIPEKVVLRAEDKKEVTLWDPKSGAEVAHVDLRDGAVVRFTYRGGHDPQEFEIKDVEEDKDTKKKMIQTRSGIVWVTKLPGMMREVILVGVMIVGIIVGVLLLRQSPKCQDEEEPMEGGHRGRRRRRDGEGKGEEEAEEGSRSGGESDSEDKVELRSGGSVAE